MQNNILNIGYLQICNYQDKHPTLFGMTPKFEQRLACASSGQTRNLHNANKRCIVLLHITSNIICQILALDLKCIGHVTSL